MAFENLKSTGIAYLLGKIRDTFVQIKDAVKTVNSISPDEYGDISLTTVPFAQNLESESNARNEESFLLRTAGGESSISDGEASLLKVLGNNVHEGYAPESIEVSVNNDSLSVDLDRDTFVGAASGSGTYTFLYTSSWSPSLDTYGITVTGDPSDGNTITVDYVAEERGTITVTNPMSFVATGWNLYNHSVGYAKAVKYGFGYKISGAYSALQYSETLNGTKSAITVTNGSFDIPADGYVWVTGGNATTTAIWLTWEDWTGTYDGNFAPYEETVIDFSSQMESYFPDGLMKAGNVVDEIDFNVGAIYSRVERLDYDAETIEAARASGLAYEYDENFIYIAKTNVTPVSFSLSSVFNANDHGIEYFTDTDVEATAQIVYGGNLKNKLERDVLTISQQSLTSAQKKQARANIGVYGENDFNDMFKRVSFTYSYSLSAGATAQLTAKNLKYSVPSGYSYFGVAGIDTRSIYVTVMRIDPLASDSIVWINNISEATRAQTLTLRVLFIKNGYNFM